MLGSLYILLMTSMADKSEIDAYPIKALMCSHVAIIVFAEGFKFCGMVKNECVGVEVCWLVDEGDPPHANFWVLPTCEYCLV